MSSSQEVSSNEERLSQVNRDADEQQMEIETVDELAIEINGGGTQSVEDENTSRSENTELQSVVQNATPASTRSVQVIASAVNSPDEFRVKVSRQAKKETKSQPKSPEKDDDAQCCPICFEPWSNSGSHRLASLNCGHLFGKSCIERWLKAKGGNDKCPQCNAPAKKKDIRHIYAKAIKSVDTTERDRALLDLEKEKEARQKAEEREARALLQYQLAKAECERILAQFKQQQDLVTRQQSERSGSCSKCKCALEEPAVVRTIGQSSNQNAILKKSYILQTSFQVTQNGARVLAFDEHHAVVVVSKPSPNQLFPGFGVVKVSSLDSKHCEFVRIHQKPVRDMAFNCRGDGLLLTASMDKTIKVTSMNSNTVVQTYSTPSHAWSCAWNNCDTNYIYCGLQNGSCLIYDVRNTGTYLKNVQDESSSACPVICVTHVSPDPNSTLRPGGILVCKLEGACLWEKTLGADYLPHHFTLPEGSCTSLSFEPSTRHCMFSLRPSKKFPSVRHLVCQLQGNGISMLTSQSQTEGSLDVNEHAGSLCTCHGISQCVGGPTQKLLSRSRLFTCPGDQRTLLVAAGDESSSSTLIWNGNNGSQLEKLPNQGKEILDVLPFTANGADLMATIDEQKLTVYKWL